MAASITVHLQIFKHPQLLRFSADLDETGIKIHGLSRYFILNIVIIRVAFPFKETKCHRQMEGHKMENKTVFSPYQSMEYLLMRIYFPV